MKLSKSISYILFSIFMVPTLFFSGFRIYRDRMVDKMLHPKYQIDTIVQTSLIKDGLPSSYLAELLDLSCDRKVNFFAFNEKEGEAKLKKSPVIKSATLKKIEPSSIYIDYSIRTPMAYLKDFSNIVIDEEGYTFPLVPYFPPAKLPEFVLGMSSLPENVEGRSFSLVMEVYRVIDELKFPIVNLSRIDVSHAFHESYGKKEIVVVFSESNYRHFLRLGVKNYRQGLENYLAIKKELFGRERKEEYDKVFDLRIPKLAFFEEVEK